MVFHPRAHNGKGPHMRCRSLRLKPAIQHSVTQILLMYAAARPNPAYTKDLQQFTVCKKYTLENKPIRRI